MSTDLEPKDLRLEEGEGFPVDFDKTRANNQIRCQTDIIYSGTTYPLPS